MRLKVKYLLAVVGVILLVTCARCREQSFSTSVAGMEQLLFTEQLLIDTVAKYTEELQAKVDILKNLIVELKTENDKATKDPEVYLHNPLNGYSLIRRMHYDWPHIEVYLAKPVDESYLKVIQKYRPQMPTSNDLYEASEAIHRLQFTYDLKPSDMSEGILHGKQYDVQLKPIDRYFMGYHLFDNAMYFDAAFWIHSAIGSYVETNYTNILSFGYEKIWSLYAETLMKQNRFKDALISIQRACHIKPKDAALMKRKLEIEHESKVNTEPLKAYPKPAPTTYELGCRGKFSNKPSRFHCLYNTTTSAFLRLAPLKMEILQLDPYLVLYHDVVSNREINYLKILAKPNLQRATVYNDDAEESKVVNTRTSKFSWFQDDTSDTTLKINQRVRDMTGFDIDGSEMLQIMNYGLGGHYDTHYDFFNASDTAEVVREEGDRISTVLFYLSDVEQGGATVFPNLKAAVYPRKGSAVVWYNLNNRVEGDSLTLHAACPVIVGSKWVCNKWIRSKAQMFRKPCYI